MYTMTELSRLNREEVAQQVMNNRLTRQLRVARSGMYSGTGNALLGRVFAWSPRKEQPAEC